MLSMFCGKNIHQNIAPCWHNAVPLHAEGTAEVKYYRGAKHESDTWTVSHVCEHQCSLYKETDRTVARYNEREGMGGMSNVC